MVDYIPRPDVDDAERLAPGTTAPQETPTPLAIPTTRPLVTVDTSQRVRQVGALVDESRIQRPPPACSSAVP